MLVSHRQLAEAGLSLLWGGRKRIRISGLPDPHDIFYLTDIASAINHPARNGDRPDRSRMSSFLNICYSFLESAP